jgi:DNA-binding CsgD family transcriptional regulator
VTDDPLTGVTGSTEGDSPAHIALALVFLVIVAGGIVDLVLDRPSTLLSAHVIFEIGMIGVSLAAVWYLGTRWFRAQALTRTLAQTVAQRLAERDAWKSRADQVLGGLGKAISLQFESWRLTPAERETALMLLKGFSHKRIAKLTGRSERTVRQHAVSVYRKSGLAGRAELAGFFLGDVTIPDPAASRDREVLEIL